MSNLLPCPFCGGEAVIVEPIYTAPDIDAWGIIQCPTCGAEMTSPSGQEEVLALWNRRAQPSEKPEPARCGCPCGDPDVSFCETCAKIRLQAIKEKLDRENPKPLTLEELRGMDGEPVYVTRISGAKIRMWVIACPNEYGLTQARTADSQFMAWSTYGRIWLAFRSKPKEEV